MSTIITPTNARKNLYNLLEKVNQDHMPITISSSKTKNDAILISKEDWDAIQKTIYLEEHGVGKVVREREKDNSGWMDASNIDWDKL